MFFLLILKSTHIVRRKKVQFLYCCKRLTFNYGTYLSLAMKMSIHLCMSQYFYDTGREATLILRLKKNASI